ncbi:MAG: glycoside hydrolase family 97 N-terminal domain-containing protein, partial [Bacteroidaceae bacterium]|nr:glycoside hydrolase family 97 N-terminal domain-containing protein [Bacteroidaceae bacterium]
MKKILLSLSLLLGISTIQAEDINIYSPDSLLQVKICENGGSPVYSLSYNGKQMLEDSPLGLKTNVADFTKGLTLKATSATMIEECYSLKNIKTSHAHYQANEVKLTLSAGRRSIGIEFRVGNNDVAFRYTLPVWGETRAC